MKRKTGIMYETYKDQYMEIKKLIRSIETKSKKFSNKKHQTLYFGDLLHVISELKDIDSFLK